MIRKQRSSWPLFPGRTSPGASGSTPAVKLTRPQEQLQRFSAQKRRRCPRPLQDVYIVGKTRDGKLAELKTSVAET
jgi:hypothetical protein